MDHLPFFVETGFVCVGFLVVVNMTDFVGDLEPTQDSDSFSAFPPTYLAWGNVPWFSEVRCVLIL
jgi:hypothetical protein